MVRGPVAVLSMVCLVALLPTPLAPGALQREAGEGHIPDLDQPYFVPRDMSLEDDGFGAGLPLHLETWYFEALLNQSRSVVFIVTVLAGGEGERGLCLTGLYMYEEGDLRAGERVATSSFRVSAAWPHLEVDGEEVCTARVTPQGDMAYRISFSLRGWGLSLTMVNRSRGWQGEMGRGWWLAVPVLAVNGTLTVDGEQVEVRGTGYHDHNRFSLFTPLLEYGYMDGKVATGEVSLVWGYIMHSRWRASAFAIISHRGDYHPLYPPHLQMEFDRYVYDHGWRIPTSCQLRFENETLALAVNMTATRFHPIRLPGLRYWRYHVETEGHLTGQSGSLAIHGRGMMERMQY
ncbi:MAG TPA: hypothetical protein ENN54_06820 [Thermoplasmatales archaeon]|nr:hypothetical protein [Thermoplasmatales archaeon]